MVENVAVLRIPWMRCNVGDKEVTGPLAEAQGTRVDRGVRTTGEEKITSIK
jgi:hypothetical protein